ncbi:MAG TPA: TonB-dependent receptor [Thermoanaerobaculia bacterium]|nr:TonB-dependent receptor [Thermoanaerobaculia bacterium]
MMRLRLSGLLSFALFLCFACSVFADGLGHASVNGVVTDETAAAIPGVTLTATRTGDTSAPIVIVTESDGRFHFDDLRPGSWHIEAALDGFKTVAQDMNLVTGQKVDIAFKLVAAFGETVEVVGERVKTGEVAILESRHQAPVVSDSISSEEIRKTPDANAAGVVERLTGVTLINDKYVFVRGLGERYSGTTINGATLPTTETEKRVVPLDLFPAKLLETVNVVKTYTPDKPGDFGSGVVEMTTTEFPSAQSMKVTAGLSYNSNATGNEFRRYAGGLDRFGGGGQKLPASIPSEFLKRRSILDPDGYTPQQLEQFGEAFIGNWTGDAISSASPASDLALTYGNTFGRLGVVLSAVSNHGFAATTEQQRFFGVDAGGELVPFNDYDMDVDRETANAGLVGNFSFRVTDNNRLYLSSVLTRDASSEDRFQQGLQTASGGDIRDYRVRYQLEQILSTRLRGEHNLGGPGIGSLVEWNVARSTASNDSDLRENIYRESDPGVFQLQTGLAESGKMEFFNLDDHITQGGAAYTMFFAAPDGKRSGSVKAGVDHLSRTRGFGARRFRFTTATLPQVDLRGTPDEIFTADTIGPNGFEVREITGVNDAYDAEHTVDAAYLMTDATSGKWRFIGGARYESSDQRVTTFNPFDTANEVEAINKKNDVLPALNVVYQLNPRTNLRFGYGRSLNRPEFRELSPFAFIEVAGGRSVAGNPDLVQATLDGYDFRWEMFPNSGEVIAASAFYKSIDKPIERVIQPTSDLRQSFVNADSANLWGFELEFRRSLESILPALRLWSVNVNYANIHSDVTVGEHQFSVVTNTDRPLEGQSDQTANVALQFYHPQWGTMLRLLGSYNGERLAEVGAFGLPDIYEASSTSFDVVISQSIAFAKGLEIKLAGSNLLNEGRDFIQGGRTQRHFEPGRKVSLSLSYSPF